MQKIDVKVDELRILMYLMTHGLSSAKDICCYTGLQRSETYNLLSSLLYRGVISSTFDRPQKYCAMCRDEVANLLLHSKKEAIELLESKKMAIHSLFADLIRNRAEIDF